MSLILQLSNGLFYIGNPPNILDWEKWNPSFVRTRRVKPRTLVGSTLKKVLRKKSSNVVRLGVGFGLHLFSYHMPFLKYPNQRERCLSVMAENWVYPLNACKRVFYYTIPNLARLCYGLKR